MLTIKEFSRPEALGEKLLRDRAIIAKRSIGARQFIAYLNKAEIGYLSFNDRSDIKTGIIYEIFVLPMYRQKGFGTQLVTFIEDIAQSAGYERIRLAAKAFDGSINQTWLKSWYEKRGYHLTLDETQEYEKYFI